MEIEIRHVFMNELTEVDINILASMMRELDINLDNVWRSGFNLRCATYDEAWYKLYLHEAKSNAIESGDNLSGFFIATVDNIVVGYIYWEEARNFQNGIQFNDIFVVQNYRRKGVATKLLTHAMKYIKETMKFSKFELEVITTNLPALNLYKKIGFYKEIKKVLLTEI